MTASFTDRAFAVTLFWLATISGVLLVAPLVFMAPLSVTSGTVLAYPIPGISLRWYAELMSDSGWIGAFFTSVIVAVGTTCVAGTLGICAAVGIASARQLSRSILLFLFLSPMIMPPVVVAVALFYFFATIRVSNSYASVIIGHSVLALPFVITPVLAALNRYDQSLTLAGLVHGGSRFAVFCRITLPVLRPSILSGLVFAFVVSFDEVVLALFLSSTGNPTLPRQLFAGVRENISPAVVAVAVVIFLVTVVLMGVASRMARR